MSLRFQALRNAYRCLYGYHLGSFASSIQGPSIMSLREEIKKEFHFPLRCLSDSLCVGFCLVPSSWMINYDVKGCQIELKIAEAG